jgi:site-specific DNA recombinase
MKAVGYISVSTDKQELSLEVQRAKIEGYAALYDVELVAVEVDAGASARTLDRPGLQRALTMLRRGEAEALLVVKLDRLTRSVKDLGTLIDAYFTRYALLSVCEQLNTKSAAGRMVINILASVSQWERETIAERTSEAVRHKQSLGEYIGGPVPYGWRLGRDKVHLIPHADEQATITRARALKAEGLSLRAIGKKLAEEGHRPRGGKAWHPETISNLLAASEAQRA